MERVRINGDVEQLIQANMINLDGIQSNSSMTQNKPLTDTQWREIQKIISELESQKMASAKAIYIHLKCTFGVEKCRDICADQYHEVKEVIDDFINTKLINKQRNRLVSQILNHPYKEQAIQFAEQQFGIIIFKRLSLPQVQKIIEYLEQIKEPEAPAIPEVDMSAPDQKTITAETTAIQESAAIIEETIPYTLPPASIQNISKVRITKSFMVIICTVILLALWFLYLN